MSRRVFYVRRAGRPTTALYQAWPVGGGFCWVSNDPAVPDPVAYSAAAEFWRLFERAGPVLDEMTLPLPATITRPRQGE
jgi:hypothetical protein